MNIVPSILSADFKRLQKELALLEGAGASYFHLDCMDGNFVQNFTFGPLIVEVIRSMTQIPLECHLYVNHPEKYIIEFAESGADVILVHPESTTDIAGVIRQIKGLNVKAGIVLSPVTQIVDIFPALSSVDYVSVLSVDPGFAGQPFNNGMVNKVKELHSLRSEKNYSYEIEVDGGINPDSAKICKEAGADAIIAGSYLFEPNQSIERFKNLKAAVRKAL